MAETQYQITQNPIQGSSLNGAAVTGTAVGNIGVSGKSVPYASSAAQQEAQKSTPPLGDGVYGEGKNGVHGKCTSGSASDSGVFGENSLGPGVTGTSIGGDGVHGQTMAQSAVGVSGTNNSAWPCVAIAGTSANGHGVHGVNQSGAGASAAPTKGCGVRGESANGYGVFGASVTSSAVYGASSSGLAGEFVGNVSVTGKLAAAAMNVSGNVSVSGNASVSGNLTAADVILTGADCAEEFDAAVGLEPGAVAVFDDDGRLRPCAVAYDKRVAGIVSGAGDYRPGVVLDRRITDRRRAPVALVGKVFCRVDASYGRIEVGDLLTTSPTSGYAMKAADPARAFGAVIGKALAFHDDGIGLVPVLVSLQ